MKLKGIVLIALIAVTAVVIVALAGFGAMGVVMFDLMSGTATGSETLSPAGTAAGHALVVYNPGLTGGPGDVAATIADDLKAAGYSVVLAGVKSPAAADVAGYDVIVVGGPIYAGNPGRSVGAYLGQLEPAADARVGVFGYGSVEMDNDDRTAVLGSVAPGCTLDVRAALKLTQQDDMEEECAGFVETLLA